jgi:hypothetical protein
LVVMHSLAHDTFVFFVFFLSCMANPSSILFRFASLSRIGEDFMQLSMLVVGACSVVVLRELGRTKKQTRGKFEAAEGLPNGYAHASHAAVRTTRRLRLAVLPSCESANV